MKLRTFLAALLLTLGIGAFTASHAVFAAEEAHGEAPAEGEEGADEGIPAEPEVGYITLDPDFVTNLASSNAREKLHYVRIRVCLMLYDAKDREVIVGLEPVLRDAMLSVICAKEFTQIASNEGRERLRQECRERILNITQEKLGVDMVRDVLFTSYLFQ